MARKTVETELTRERIMEAAAKLFIAYGYRPVSMRKIAEELGYSHGSLYYHFKSKADLFSSLVMEEFKKLMDLLKNVLDQTKSEGPVETLKVIMLEFIRFGLDNRYHYELMFIKRDENLLPIFRKEQAVILEKLAKMVYNAYDLPADKSRWMAPWHMYLSVHGFISYGIRYQLCYEEVQSLAEYHVDHLLMGVSTLK